MCNPANCCKNKPKFDNDLTIRTFDLLFGDEDVNFRITEQLLEFVEISSKQTQLFPIVHEDGSIPEFDRDWVNSQLQGTLRFALAPQNASMATMHIWQIGCERVDFWKIADLWMDEVL